MGTSPKNEVVKERKTKWAVQVRYLMNGSRTSDTVKGLDAPTENEVIKALYEKCGHSMNVKFSNIEIYHKYTYME